jgi:hypothetical protein
MCTAIYFTTLPDVPLLRFMNKSKTIFKDVGANSGAVSPTAGSIIKSKLKQNA